MTNPKAHKLIQDVMSLGNITINGKNPWDIKVKNDNFYKRLLRTHPSLALGESYMAGEWECDELDEFVVKIFEANIHGKVRKNFRIILGLLGEKVKATTQRYDAFDVAKKHYDLGNDLFEAMLDKRLVYTCAYWKNAKNLDQAQESKLDLVCQKLHLKPGMKVLDIGGGWGSFAKYAAEKYKVSVVNITISQEQVELADKLCKGLPVENRLQDYHDVDEVFDRIVSLGMFEHVGSKNYRTFMEIVNKNLKDDGLFLLHTIGVDFIDGSPDPWYSKYIFPNSELPSLEKLIHSYKGLFITEDFQNLGANYNQTLLAWFNNFDKSWPKLKEKYGEEFYRMWKYYLLTCAGLFRVRYCQLWQFVLSKKGIKGGYTPVR